MPECDGRTSNLKRYRPFPVAPTIAELVRYGGHVMKSKSRIAAYILIGLGIIFLLSNLGLLPPLRSLMAHWWPVILIIVGIWLLLRQQSSGKS